MDKNVNGIAKCMVILKSTVSTHVCGFIYIYIHSQEHIQISLQTVCYQHSTIQQ